MDLDQYHPIRIERQDNEVISEAYTLLNQSNITRSAGLDGSGQVHHTKPYALTKPHSRNPRQTPLVLSEAPPPLVSSEATHSIDWRGLRSEVLHYRYLNSTGYADMGNKNAKKYIVDGKVYTPAAVQQKILRLQKELEQKETENEEWQTQCAEAQAQLTQKQKELVSLSEELDKVKSVLQHKLTRGKPDILAAVQEEDIEGHGQVKKKQGVSGESTSLENISLKQYKKDFSSKNLIKSALKNNDFLKNLEKNVMHEMVNCMYEERITSGQYIITENEAGNHLYVSSEGYMEVLKNGNSVGQLPPGTAFGELAILYGCTRTASIRAMDNARIWVLERKIFQTIMMRSGMQRQKERIQFLSSVQHLKNLGIEKLSKIADILDVEFFDAGRYIIREGEVGDNFYIIADGRVKVTQRIMGESEPQEIRQLERGHYFGERALLTEDRRTASVIAIDSGVELLTLNRESFISLIGELDQLKKQDYGDIERKAEWQIIDESKVGQQSQSGQSRTESITVDVPVKDINLSSLEIIATLGIGGFGRVELVQCQNDRRRTYALKILKKQHIVETRQMEHIYSEKRVMMTCQSPYIVQLYKTFKDRKFVYMLMEACLGGELWTILRDQGYFDDQTARFVVACVIKAFQYLHAMGIIYRDLKPENLLVTAEGYVKLVDFGFAKSLPAGKKTWTFCGTPEYVAPEIILNKGHDHAVDIWAMGILIYELTAGAPPFAAHDPMKTYNIILRGIDQHEFPKRVGRNAQHIIKRMCRENPSDRLGYQKNGLTDVIKHRWFQGFDWEGLEQREIQPPLKRKVNGPCDVSNFDQYKSDVCLPPDETSGWDDDF